MPRPDLSLAMCFCEGIILILATWWWGQAKPIISTLIALSLSVLEILAALSLRGMFSLLVPHLGLSVTPSGISLRSVLWFGNQFYWETGESSQFGLEKPFPFLWILSRLALDKVVKYAKFFNHAFIIYLFLSLFHLQKFVKYAKHCVGFLMNQQQVLKWCHFVQMSFHYNIGEMP